MEANKKTAETQGINIQSVTRAMNILKFIAASNNSASLSAISQGVGLGASTTHNLLKTLKQGGFVLQLEAGGPYSIGVEILTLASAVKDNSSLTALAKASMENLSHKYNESVNLSAFIDGYAVYIECIECTHDVRIMTYVGKRNPPHVTGAGKVLLAWQPADVIEAYLKAPLMRKTMRTITDADQLRMVLKRIHDQGYGLDEGEYQEDIWCAAAPIMNHLGELLAVISISFPANRISMFNKDLVIGDVIRAANEVSQLYGYNI